MRIYISVHVNGAIANYLVTNCQDGSESGLRAKKLTSTYDTRIPNYLVVPL